MSIRVPRGAARALWVLLPAVLAAGCRGSSGARPEGPAAPPGVGADAPVPAEPASPPGPRADALKHLEAKLKPKAPPPESSPPPDPGARLLQVEALVRAFAKEIEAGELEKARGFLIGEKDLAVVAAEGVRGILAANLLPKNRRDLDQLFETARGKKVAFQLWTPGKLYLADPQSFYRPHTPILQGGRLDLAVGDQTVHLGLDLLDIDGSWKVFRLD